MKIAIPVYQGLLCAHFGHCESFAVIEADEATGEIRGRNDLAAPPHQPGLLPKWLAGEGVDTVIAGGMGQRALGLFSSYGIRVITGAPAAPPEELVRRFLAGNLETGENACDH